MAEITKRTLLSEYMLDGNRRTAGQELELTPKQFKRAVQAGVVHEDKASDDEVREANAKRQAEAEAAAKAAKEVNDAAGRKADETKEPAPARQAGRQRRARR